MLCDLEGHTHQEAARFLGWPIGTVKSRHWHGRRLMRDRLVRRGLGLACAGAVMESLRKTTLAALPKQVSRRTVNAAMAQSARLLTAYAVSAHVLSLTQGVLQAMLWIKVRYFMAFTVVIGIAYGTAGIYVLGSQDPASKGGQPASKRRVTASGQGSDSSNAENRDVPTAKLRAQQLATRKAKAFYEIARLNRELAELNLEEYQEVVYARDLTTVEAEIKLAESDLTRSEDRTDWAKRMFDKKYVSQAQKRSEELNLKKAQFSLEQAQSKRDVLVKYTKGKTIKELRSAVEKARVDELNKEAAWDLERAKEVELSRPSSR